MFSALLLAVALAAPMQTPQGPHKEWLQGVIGGQTVMVYGWRVNGGAAVQYEPADNPHLFAPALTPAPAAPQGKAPPKQFASGVLIEGDGTYNAGIEMGAIRPTEGLETNDPKLGEKLGLVESDDSDFDPSKCGPDSDPDEDPDFLGQNSFGQHGSLYAIGVIALIALILLWPSGQER